MDIAHRLRVGLLGHDVLGAGVRKVCGTHLGGGRSRYLRCGCCIQQRYVWTLKITLHLRLVCGAPRRLSGRWRRASPQPPQRHTGAHTLAVAAAKVLNFTVQLYRTVSAALTAVPRAVPYTTVSRITEPNGYARAYSCSLLPLTVVRPKSSGQDAALVIGGHRRTA